MPCPHPREEYRHKCGRKDEVQIDLPRRKGRPMTAHRRIPLPPQQPGKDEAREANGSQETSTQLRGHLRSSASLYIATKRRGLSREVDGEVIDLLVVLLAGVLVHEQLGVDRAC